MPPITSTHSAWVEAGGDAERLRILSRAGTVQPFTDGDSRVLAGIHPGRPAVGTLGDWVGGQRVVDAAIAWLAEQGASAAEGPKLLAPWFPYRANLGPFEQPPLTFEPTERGDRWDTAGFTPCAHYVSILSAHSAQIEAGMAAAAALSTRGWQLEPMERGPSSNLTTDGFNRAVHIIHDLSSRAFADEPGYLPVAADIVADFYRPMAQVLDPRLSLFAIDPKGRPAGFLLGLPDPNQPKRRWFQILSLAVAPEFRGTGVATWLVAAAHQAARRAGYLSGVHALVRTGKPGEQTPWFRGEPVRRYALFRKSW